MCEYYYMPGHKQVVAPCILVNDADHAVGAFDGCIAITETPFHIPACCCITVGVEQVAEWFCKRRALIRPFTTQELLPGVRTIFTGTFSFVRSFKIP